MNVSTVNEKTIHGLRARTNNNAEMNATTGKIAPLVKRFDDGVTVDYKNGARVYSVYYDYESDFSGDYSVLIGADRVESASCALEQVVIQSGKYLVFVGQGPVPQVVFETWSRIWQYFSDDACPHKRAYTTDFEFYKSQQDVEIHIAIKD